MDIKKITTQLGQAQQTRQSRNTADTGAVSGEKSSFSDKVTLDGYSFRMNEMLFARSEYNKHVQSAFEKLPELNAKIKEYEEAVSDPDKNSGETEVGQQLRSETVLEQIAKSILGLRE